MTNIFISYRREDSAGWVRALAKDLGQIFGEDGIFLDIDTLEAGVDYIDKIDRRLASCDIALIIIGNRWLSASNHKNVRRLDNPEDLLRIEISKILERRIAAIPILVGGASMPSADDLPSDLRALVRRNAYDVSDRRWNHDVQKLIDLLKKRREKIRLSLSKDERAVSNDQWLTANWQKNEARESLTAQNIPVDTDDVCQESVTGVERGPAWHGAGRSKFTTSTRSGSGNFTIKC